jgi:hypothetical protein
VCADPDRFRLGFFSVRCFPWLCRTAHLPLCRGRGGEGKQAVVPPAALLPSILYSIVKTACKAWRCVPSRPMCHLQRAWRVLHLGTTAGPPLSTATPRHHGRGSSVSPVVSPREGLSGVGTSMQRRQAIELSEPPHERREPRVLGLLDSVQAHQYTREQSHGSPPVLGI